MANGKFVTYYRVSTQRQGVSGLGLEAQRESVRQHLNGSSWEVIEEFVEVESGRKTNDQRPKLAAALAACKKQGAVLLVAKLDRLARNVHFVSGLMQAGVKFVAVDLPEANDLTIHIMAAFAEHEAKRISQRTKDTIASKKARVEAGTDKSGKTVWAEAWGVAGPSNLRSNIEDRKALANTNAKKLEATIGAYRAAGMSLSVMVKNLNDSGASTTHGKLWSVTQLRRVMARLAELAGAPVL